MKVNGLELPPTFVRDVQSGKFYRERGVWELIETHNAYGEHLETELAEVFETVAQIEGATGELAQDFACIGPEDDQFSDEMFGDTPGYLPGIRDFSQLVWFAMAGDGAPFCFDFRDAQNSQEPRVIWWADAFWQRVAPDYEAFVRLFDLTRPIGANS